MTDDLPAFDSARLIAGLRAGDQRAIEEAYRRTFGTDYGRMVLAHHLVDCGVGNTISAATDGELRERIGRHNAALELVAKAGFDQASIAAAVLTDSLEEQLDVDPELLQPAYVPADDDDLGL